jgi:hypothetical protein
MDVERDRRAIDLVEEFRRQDRPRRTEAHAIGAEAQDVRRVTGNDGEIVRNHQDGEAPILLQTVNELFNRSWPVSSTPAAAREQQDIGFPISANATSRRWN